MVGKVIGFYVNAGTGAVRLALNVTTGTLKLVGSVAERAMGVSRAPSGEPGYKPAAAAAARAASDAPPETAKPEGASPEPALEAEPAEPEPAPPERPPAVDYDAEPRTPIDRAEEDAKTIDDEPELVAEFAERGAENGAGASATVDEPWEGYAQMSADVVIARIGEADLAELAVVELYEQAHSKRQTVLQAAERRHRSLTGPGAAQ